MSSVAPDGYSQSPGCTGIDALDSHWFYCSARALQFQQQLPTYPVKLGGIIEARDWPFQEALENGLYLVTGSSKSSKSVNSQQSALATYAARWCWLVLGTDLISTVQGSSRGDKSRQTAYMRSLMRYALYPGFTQKQQYAVVDDGTGNPLLTATPFPAQENVWWSKPDFAERADQTTGVLFTYASVSISAFEPEINS